MTPAHVRAQIAQPGEVLALGGAAIILFALIASGTISGSDFGPHVGNISFFPVSMEDDSRKNYCDCDE